MITTVAFRLLEEPEPAPQRETLTIAGFALDGNDWDGIYLGRRKGDDLVYAGKVDHGFDKQSSAELRKRLTPLIRKTQPYVKRIAHKGIWVGSSTPRSSTEPSPPRARCGIRFFGGCGRTCDGRFRPLLQWANKPSHSRLTISADLHHSSHIATAGGMARPRQGQ